MTISSSGSHSRVPMENDISHTYRDTRVHSFFFPLRSKLDRHSIPFDSLLPPRPFVQPNFTTQGLSLCFPSSIVSTTTYMWLQEEGGGGVPPTSDNSPKKTRGNEKIPILPVFLSRYRSLKPAPLSTASPTPTTFHARVLVRLSPLGIPWLTTGFRRRDAFKARAPSFPYFTYST